MNDKEKGVIDAAVRYCAKRLYEMSCKEALTLELELREAVASYNKAKETKEEWPRVLSSDETRQLLLQGLEVRAEIEEKFDAAARRRTDGKDP